MENRNEIENEEEFRKLLIRMYEENSFHSVKLSTDISDTEKVYMKVYPFRETIIEKEMDPELEFKYIGCLTKNLWYLIYTMTCSDVKSIIVLKGTFSG